LVKSFLDLSAPDTIGLCCFNGIMDILRIFPGKNAQVHGRHYPGVQSIASISWIPQIIIETSFKDIVLPGVLPAVLIEVDNRLDSATTIC
ncbi:MAG: hypothetical protein WAP09_08015, partial [Desulfomonilia bacterium]